MSMTNLTVKARPHLGFILVSIAVTIYIINSLLLWNFELDDALIYARYIENFTQGNGLVYNPGERVNGLTSPLFAYLAIPVTLVIGDSRDAIMLVSVLAMAGSTLVFYQLLNQMLDDSTAAAVSALLACMAVASYINQGMETSLFVLVFAVCLQLYFRDAHRWLGVALGLLILTRPEGVLLVPALAINTHVFKRAWPDWRCYLLPTLMVAAQITFNGLYYGEVLQSSGVAKIYQGQSGLWAADHFLLRLLLQFSFGFLHNGNWIVMGILLVCAGCSVFVRSAKQYLLLTLVFLCIYTAFYLVLRIPSQNWYYGIYFSLFWSYVAIGLAAIASRLTKEFRGAFYGTLIASLLLLFIWQEPSILRTYGATVRQDYRAIGQWLAVNTPSDSSIAMVEIGTVGWYSEREVVDILGLVSPGLSELIARGELTGWTDVYQPDYMLVHEPLWDLERGLVELSERASVLEVTEFDFPGFRLMKIE